MTTITSITPAQLTHGQWLQTTGRDAPFDGGGGALYYDAGSAVQPDGGIVYAVPGAPGRLLRQGYTVFCHVGDVQAAWFGVGTAPAASDAGLAAIQASPHVGMATVRLPAKTVINQPFVNTIDARVFKGNGTAPYLVEFTDEQLLAASASIIEAGPAFPVGATLWTDSAKTAPGSLPRSGGGLCGVTLNGRKRAAVCHAVLTVTGGEFTDVLALDAADAGLSFGVVHATDGTRIGSSSRCRFTNYGAVGGLVGIALWGNVEMRSNACLSTFVSCTARGGTCGWELGDCDSNWLFGCGGGELVLHAGDTCARNIGTTRAARANVIVAWQGGITAKANIDPASPPSYRNIVIGFSRENGADLVVESGAKIISMVDQSKRLGDCAGHMMGLEPAGLLVGCKVNGQVVPTGAWAPVIWGPESYEMPPYTHASLVPEVVVPGSVVQARVQATIVFASTQEKGRLSARLLVNGAELPQPVFADAKAASSGPLLLQSAPFKCKAGDVLTVEVMQTTGANLTLTEKSWLGVEWL